MSDLPTLNNSEDDPARRDNWPPPLVNSVRYETKMKKFWLIHGATEPTHAAIWRWWGKRWLIYNIILLAVGLGSCFLCIFVGSLAVQGGQDFVQPLLLLFGVPVYAILANICYLLGPIFDTFFFIGRPRWWLFVLGLSFAVLLTAAPGAWAILAWITTVITGKKLE